MRSYPALSMEGLAWGGVGGGTLVWVCDWGVAPVDCFPQPSNGFEDLVIFAGGSRVDGARGDLTSSHAVVRGCADALERNFQSRGKGPPHWKDLDVMTLRLVAGLSKGAQGSPPLSEVKVGPKSSCSWMETSASRRPCRGRALAKPGARFSAK